MIKSAFVKHKGNSIIECMFEVVSIELEDLHSIVFMRQTHLSCSAVKY